MTNETVTRDIAAEPAQVWAVITDVEKWPEVLSSVAGVELLTDGPYRTGTMWRETRRSSGHEETHEMKVTEVEALGLARIERTGGDADAHTASVTTFKLEATHPGTRVTLTSEGAPTEDAGTFKKLAARIVAPLGDKTARTQLESDLAQIAAATERR